MKRPRKDVTLEIMPSGGVYQILYIDWNDIEEYATGFSLGFAEPLAGPFLYNLFKGEIVPFVRTKFHCDWLQQGEYVGRDSFVFHGSAEGILRDFDGTYTEPFSETIEGDIQFSLSTSLMRSELQGEKLPGLVVYKFGSSETDYTPAHLAGGAFVGRAHYETSSTEAVELSAIYGGNRQIRVSRDPERGGQHMSLELVPDLTRRITDGLIPLVVKKEYQVGDSEIITSEIQTRVRAIPVSPIIIRTDERIFGIPQRIRDADNLLREIMLSTISDQPRDGEFFAAQQAVEGFHAVNVNGIAYIKDLFALKELIEPAVKVLKNPRNLKNWVNMFLSWWYGSRLFKQDTAALWRALSQVRKASKSLREYLKYKNSLQTRYGTFTEFDETDLYEGRYRFNSRVVAKPLVPVEDTPLNELTAFLNDMGLRLTGTNLWDLVPFSFVLDWFINVGGLIEKVDYTAECLQMKVREVVSSLKFTGMMKSDALKRMNFTGEISFKVYERRVLNELPRPQYGLDASLAFLRHWWEGALIILGGKHGLKDSSSSRLSSGGSMVPGKGLLPWNE